jgi:hypothetical protein
MSREFSTGFFMKQLLLIPLESQERNTNLSTSDGVICIRYPLPGKFTTGVSRPSCVQYLPQEFSSPRSRNSLGMNTRRSRWKLVHETLAIAKI